MFTTPRDPMKYRPNRTLSSESNTVRPYLSSHPRMGENWWSERLEQHIPSRFRPMATGTGGSPGGSGMPINFEKLTALEFDHCIYSDHRHPFSASSKRTSAVTGMSRVGRDLAAPRSVLPWAGGPYSAASPVSQAHAIGPRTPGPNSAAGGRSRWNTSISRRRTPAWRVESRVNAST